MYQAIMSIRELRPLAVKFEKRALLAFGATKWRSARELKTVCQIVALKLDENDSELKWDHLSLSSDIQGFEDIVEQSKSGFTDCDFVHYEE